MTLLFQAIVITLLLLIVTMLFLERRMEPLTNTEHCRFDRHLWYYLARDTRFCRTCGCGEHVENQEWKITHPYPYEETRRTRWPEDQ